MPSWNKSESPLLIMVSDLFDISRGVESTIRDWIDMDYQSPGLSELNMNAIKGRIKRDLIDLESTIHKLREHIDSVAYCPGCRLQSHPEFYCKCECSGQQQD